MQNNNQQNMMKLSDQDMLTDLLTQEREMVKGYGDYITETSCPNMRQVLTMNMTQTAQDQYQVFAQMSSRGWYPTEDAPAQKVQQAKQKMQQVKGELCP